MRRSAEEMTDLFRKVIASQSEDEIASYLEDINDSVSEPDMTGLVSREEYEKIVGERDTERARANDYRDRYINRFYNRGNDTNDKTYIEGAAPQTVIEDEEKRIGYDDLFE